MTRVALLAVLALTACATAPPAKPVPPTQPAHCIPLGTITPAEQKAAGDTLAGLAAAQQAALAPIITDWQAMRDADRACLKAAPTP